MPLLLSSVFDGRLMCGTGFPPAETRPKPVPNPINGALRGTWSRSKVKECGGTFLAVSLGLPVEGVECVGQRLGAEPIEQLDGLLVGGSSLLGGDAA